MPRPRILGSYNRKRWSTDNEREKEVSDRTGTNIKEKNRQVTAINENNTKKISRIEKEGVVITKMTHQGTYRLLNTEKLTKRGQLGTDESATSCESSSTLPRNSTVEQARFAKNSAKIYQLVANPSTGVTRLVPDTSTRVATKAQLISNSPMTIAQLLSDSSKKLTSFAPNSSKKITRLIRITRTEVEQLLSNGCKSSSLATVIPALSGEDTEILKNSVRTPENVQRKVGETTNRERRAVGEAQKQNNSPISLINLAERTNNTKQLSDKILSSHDNDDDKVGENDKINDVDKKKVIKLDKIPTSVEKRDVTNKLKITTKKNVKFAGKVNKTTEVPTSSNDPAKNEWLAKCIICQQRFTNKYEFHRHITQSHPGVRIIFCESCNSPFANDSELKRHHTRCHQKATVRKDTATETDGNIAKTDGNVAKTSVATDNETGNRIKNLDKNRSKSSVKEPVAGHSSSIGNLRSRVIKKKTAALNTRSRNLIKFSQSASSATIGHGSQTTRTKNRTKKSTYNYVDVDVIRHDAVATRNKFKSAEIKKLVVPLTRLEDPVLEIYQKKLNAPKNDQTSTRLEERGNFSTDDNSLVSSNLRKISANSRRSSANETSVDQRRRRRRLLRVRRRSGRFESGKVIKIQGPKRGGRRRIKRNEIREVLESSSRDSTIPRRSARRRIPKKLLYNSESDGTTDGDAAKIFTVNTNDENGGKESTDRHRVSRKTRKLRKIESNTDFDKIIRSNQDLTPIKINEMNQVAEIIKEQRVIRKLVSRSSLSGCSAVENTGEKYYSNSDKRSKIKRISTKSFYSMVKNASDKNPSSGTEISKQTNPKKLRRKIETIEPTERSKSSLSNDETILPGDLSKSVQNAYKFNANPHEIMKKNQKKITNDEIIKENDREERGEKTSNDSENKEARGKINDEDVHRKEQQPKKSIKNYGEREEKTRNGGLNDEEKESLEKEENENDDDSMREITLRKTYSPGKKYFTIVGNSKQGSDEAANSQKPMSCQDLCCFACKQLRIWMKKISNKVANKNAAVDTVIKCPSSSCHRYFISMFHLELHVANNHLPCRNKVRWKKLVSSNVQKLSQDTVTTSAAELDCQIEVKTGFECPRCSVKFNAEKDLNDHAIAQHDLIPYLKDTVSSNQNAPEYLKSLSASCLETIVSENAADISSRQNDEKTTDSSLTLVRCSLCDSKFSKTTQYVRHAREMHQTPSPKRRASFYPKTNSKKFVNEQRTNYTLYGEEEEEEDYNNDKDPTPTHCVENILEIDSNDRTMTDREYLLKQLLSDDSSDNDENTKSLTDINRPPEFGKLEMEETTKKDIVQEPLNNATTVGFVSSLHTCNVCHKTFERAQDLLIHGLCHANKEISETNAGNVESLANKRHCEQLASKTMNKLVVNSDEKLTVTPSVRESSLSSSSPRVKSSRTKNVDSSERHSSENDKIKEFTETEVGLGNAEIDEKSPIACDKCNRHFANRSLLNEHLFFLHDDSLKDTVLTDVLAQTGGNSRGLDERKVSKRLRCETCNQHFKLSQGYGRHRYYVHGDDSMVHVCDNCSKVLTNITMVNVHICTDVASYNCRTCNETFPTGMSLRLHNTEKHTETDGPHACEPCKKTFLTNAMLRRHESSQHRLVRPYRARKSSPIRMAGASAVPTPETTNNEESEKPTRSSEPLVGDEMIEQINTRKKTSTTRIKRGSSAVGSRRGRWRNCRGNKEKARDKSPVVNLARTQRAPGTRRRGRPRKYPLFEPNLPRDPRDSMENEEGSDNENKEQASDIWKESTLYVDETDIHQCSLCQIYCLSRSALRNHMAKIHSTTDEVCQLCQKMYPTGKLLRHMIENHISSDNRNETMRLERSWQIGKDCNEIDTEIFVRMLGIDRLVSLCEYRRYAEINDVASYPCPYCDKTFPSSELYRYHFLLHHDAICVLCNIEYKRGADAARHKGEIHGSFGRYVWFADRTVVAMTSTKNFTDTAEKIFIETLMKNDEDKYDDDDADNSSEDTNHFLRDKSIKNRTTNEDDNNDNNNNGDASSIISDDFAEPEDVGFVIVVTDEDIEKFNITTRHPNIWGLAAKISSTFCEITPGEVKVTLERYFERREDFDT